MTAPINFSLDHLNSTETLDKYFQSQLRHSLNKVEARINKISKKKSEYNSDTIELKKEKLKQLEERLTVTNLSTMEKKYLTAKVQLINEKYFQAASQTQSKEIKCQTIERVGVETINYPSFLAEHIYQFEDLSKENPKAAVLNGYLTNEYKTPIESISFKNTRGCCRGESKWFLILYLRMRDKNPQLDISTIMEAISKEFKYGAKGPSLLLQNSECFDSSGLTLPTITESDPTGYSNFYNISLNDPETIINSNLSSLLKALEDGAYSISLPKHKVALIKENNTLYLFDPNYGIFKSNFAPQIANKLSLYESENDFLILKSKKFWIAEALARDPNSQFSYQSVEAGFYLAISESKAMEWVKSLLELKKIMKGRNLDAVLLDSILNKISHDIETYVENKEQVKSFIILLNIIALQSEVSLDPIMHFIAMNEDPENFSKQQNFIDSVKFFIHNKEYKHKYPAFKRLSNYELGSKMFQIDKYDANDLMDDLACMLIQEAYKPHLKYLYTPFKNKSVQAIFEAFVDNPQKNIKYLKLKQYFIDNNLPYFNDFMAKMKLFFDNGNHFFELFKFEESHFKKDTCWKDPKGHLEKYKNYIKQFSDANVHEDAKLGFDTYGVLIDGFYPVKIYRETLKK